MGDLGRITEDIRVRLADERLQAALKKALGTVRAKSAESLAELEDPDAARETAGRIRQGNIQHLGSNLEQLEARLTAAGTEVLWAETAGDVRNHVISIARENLILRAILSKSMVAEEVDLEHGLRAAGVNVVQTDLGERIVQLAGERPSHITAPCLHMSAGQIGRVLQVKTGMAYSDDPEDLCRYLASSLRPVFGRGQLGISGANLAVSRSGQLVMVENEGNVRMGYTLPSVHVVVVGIERTVGTIEEAGMLLSLLPRMATGQRFTSYVTVLSPVPLPGQKRTVILVDNGRSRVFRAGPFRDLLRCIRCGACMNICPVYERVGGHAYQWTYPGPIGIALAPFMGPAESAPALPHLCTLCGACTEVCPVRIPLDRLIVLARDLVGQEASRDAASRQMSSALKIFSWFFRGRVRYRLSHWGHKRLTGMFPGRAARLNESMGWEGPRCPPLPSRRLFRQRAKDLGLAP